MTKKVPFDGVYKMGGVYAGASAATRGWITVREMESGVAVVIGLMTRVMTPAAVRSFAAQIMEAARRHEIREGGK